MIRELNAELTLRLRLLCRVSVGEGGNDVVEVRDQSLDVVGGQLRRAAARSQLTLHTPSALHGLGYPPAHERPGLGLGRQHVAVAVELPVALLELAAELILPAVIERQCVVAYDGPGGGLARGWYCRWDSTALTMAGGGGYERRPPWSGLVPRKD